MSLFSRISHVSITVTDVEKARDVFVKDPDGNMVEFIGPSAKAGEHRMEAPRG